MIGEGIQLSIAFVKAADVHLDGGADSGPRRMARPADLHAGQPLLRGPGRLPGAFHVQVLV
ncbi:hypothetical protein D3C85_1709090 [compost metagenome]